MKIGPKHERNPRPPIEHGQHKAWKRKLREAEKAEDTAEFAEEMRQLYESKRRSCT